MNNADFRDLLKAPSSQQGTSSKAEQRPTTSLLGSRNKSLPFKPRAVEQKPRQVKSSVPKGVKLASGYQDRVALRNQAKGGEDEVKDEREVRINALEAQLKLGQIDRATFENQRDKITGGDESATHLVKGLDRQLLARIRSERNGAKGVATEAQEEEFDVDGELDQLETEEVAPVQKEIAEKQGIVAQPAPVAGKKRSRNDILAELRASRKAAAEAAPVPKSTLAAGFKKMGQTRADGPKVEIDEKGREVLITVDKNGRVKRKVRKVEQPASSQAVKSSETVNMTPLGMDVPGYRKPSELVDEDEELEDLFDGVGASYDPLAALRAQDDDDDDEDEDANSDLDKEDGESKRRRSNSDGDIKGDKRDSTSRDDRSSASHSPATPEAAPGPRKKNYFKDTSDSKPKQEESAADALKDPSLMAALRLAARRDKKAAEEKAAKEAAPSAAARRLLHQRDRDLDDIDMGFGGSRGADEDDEDEGNSRVKLREWKGMGAGDDDEDERKDRGGQKQRKRGKKKKGGDKNNAADIMRIAESRKAK